MNETITGISDDGYLRESNPYSIKRTVEEPASLFTVFNFRNQYHFLFKMTKGVPTLVLLDKVSTFDHSKEPVTYIIEEETTSAIKVPSYLFESRRALDEKIQKKEAELKELEKRIEVLKKEVNQI
jgi:hypothetical protein